MIFEERENREIAICIRITKQENKKVQEMLKHYDITKSVLLRGLINNYYDNEFKKE